MDFGLSDNPMEDKSLTDITPLDGVWVINFGNVRVDRLKLNHPEQLAIKGTYLIRNFSPAMLAGRVPLLNHHQ